MTGHESITLASIGLLILLCQWLAYVLRLPAILFLLISGILAGPVAGLLETERLFGDLLFPIVSLGVAVILFEGALTLKIDEIKGLAKVVRNLVTVGLMVTWVITAVVSRWALGLPWELAFLFGAVVSVTGPTVVMPLLRTVMPNSKIANILRWEGIAIDPIGALLAVLVYEFIISSQEDPALGHTLLVFGKIGLVGVVAGLLGGWFTAQILRRHWLPEHLHNVGVLLLVIGFFAISNVMQEESGLLTVTVMGFFLANLKEVPLEELINFKESLSLLFISALFIILAARVDIQDIRAIGFNAVWVILGIQFIARPAKAFVSTLGSTLTWQERVLIGWIAPRGIVAAAVSALFAIRLEQRGDETAALLVPLTFIVIISTVVVQSATARPLAKALKVTEPEPNGFLIIGANQVARTIGKAIKDNDLRVLLADSNWENIGKARMEGLDTYYGNPASDHADKYMTLTGVGNLLALSPSSETNLIATFYFRGDFGRNAVFALQTATEQGVSEKHRAGTLTRAQTAFNESATYAKLSRLITQGAEVRSTLLSEDFTFEQYLDTYTGRATPLFAVDKKGHLQIFVAGGKMQPGPGWKVTSLIEQGTQEKHVEKVIQSHAKSAQAEEKEEKKKQNGDKNGAG